MGATGKSTPSDPELDFGELVDADGEGPTRKLPTLGPDVAEILARRLEGGGDADTAAAVRETAPAARTDIRRSVTPLSAPPVRRTSHAPRGASQDPPTVRRPSLAPPSVWPAPDRWSSDAEGEPSRPAHSSVRAGGARPSDGVGEEAELSPRTSTRPAMVAPPPPRLPALPLDIDISIPLDLDPPAAAPAAVARNAPSSLGVPTRDELSWDRTTPDPAPPELPHTLHEPLALHHGHERLSSTALPALTDDGAGDAYSLVNKASLTPVALAPPDPRREMHDRFALGDFSGALVIAEALTLEQRIEPDVDRVIRECRAKLEQMYASRLGAPGGVPAIAVPRTDLKWLSLDHRAGFVLSLVDGVCSVEEIIDVTGMAPLEVLRTLYELLSQRVIEIRPARAK